MKLAIVIPIYNRPQYVVRCFASLDALRHDPDIIVTVNDASTEIIPTLRQRIKGGVIEITHNTNRGVRGSLLSGIECAIEEGADTICVVDSDVILKPDALKVMLATRHKDKMISGINCTMVDNGIERNPLVSEHKGYSLKKAVAGQCLMFTVDQYHKWVKPALEVVGNWDHNASINSMKDGKPVVVCVPSVAQHIGIVSSMGHNHIASDRADDFKVLSLPNVTLFGIDSHDVAGINRAAAICKRDINFGAVNIITKDLFTKGGTSEQRRKDYSRFMIKELNSQFNTSHVLSIHTDGYILNPEAWNPEWLNYDYIGGTWWYKDNMNVGNGGFSLRSKKLCSILAEYELSGDHYHPEDHHICRTYRPALEEMGIRFAPEEVANQFSIEAYGVPAPHNQYSGQFGFHGVHVDCSTALQYNVPSDILYKKPAAAQQRTFVKNNRTFVRR